MNKLVPNAGIKSSNFLQSLQKQIAILLFSIVIIALLVNLGLLTYLGPKGEELSRIRNAQEEQKLQNDLMRAELENMKVSSLIENKAQNDLQMRKADVIFIDPEITKTQANND